MNDHSLLISMMDRLSRFQNVKVGRGPNHPIAPTDCNRLCIGEFLAKYSVLKDFYPDYVDFLMTFSGANINYELDIQDDLFLHLDLYGFDDSVTDVYQDDSFDIEDQGFLIFADLDYRYRKWDPDSGLPFDGVKHSFGLINLSPERKYGIYLFTYDEHFDPNEKEDFSDAIYFSDTFLEWLNRYVSSGGRIPEVSKDEFSQIAQQPVL